MAHPTQDIFITPSPLGDKCVKVPYYPPCALSLILVYFQSEDSDFAASSGVA